MKPVHFHSGLVLVGVSICMPPMTRAQEAPTSDARMLQEVVVTADWRSERPLDVAGSVSVISAAEIETLHATRLMDLAASVPGLVIGSNGSPGQTTIALRGLPAVSNGAVVVSLVDDVAVESSSASTNQPLFELDLLPYDIERIEVLYGPQGTLYGANSMDGVLKYVTKEPDLSKSVAQIGGDLFAIKNGGSAGAAAGGWWSAPLVDGALAVRASVYARQTPGYIENPLRGLSHENSHSEDSGRLALLWQPSNDLQVRVQGIYQQTHSDGDANIFAQQLGTPQDPYYRPGAWLGGDLVYPHVLAEPFTSELKFFSGTVDWRTSFASLASVTGYWDKQLEQVADTSLVYGYLQPVLDPSVTSQLNRSRFYVRVQRFSQELRLLSPAGGQVDWLAGVYYCHENDSTSYYLDALNSDLRPIPALTPFYAATGPATYSEAAMFGSLTYRLSSRFDLTGGMRWTTNRQHVDTDIYANQMGPISNSFDRSAEQPKTYDFSARYHLQPDTMTYVRIATGYRPGTPNQVIPGYPQIPPQTKSDTMVNYEIGIKSELINRKASLDLAVYKINWSDIQVYVPTPDGLFYYVINAPKATSEGVEFAATYSPVDALHFEGNAAYTDAFATEAVPSANIFAGTRMPNSPRWTSAARLDLRLWNFAHWTSHLSGTWRYIAPELSSLSTAPPVGQMPGYSWVDLELRMTKGRYDVALYAKNLTDKRAFNNGGPLTANTAGPNAPLPPGPPSPSFGGVPIEPRVVGVSVTVSL